MAAPTFIPFVRRKTAVGIAGGGWFYYITRNMSDFARFTADFV